MHMRFVTDFLTSREGSGPRDFLVLLVGFGLLFTLFLGRLPLQDPDEGRYAEIPREMLERGDLVTPRLNYVKYFEKPPLHYWLNAGSQSIFGRNEFAARFPSALLGICGVLLTWYAGRRVFGRREGLYGAMVLGSSVMFAWLARMNSIDMTLTFFMTATLVFFLIASREGEKRKGLFYHLFYLCAALTVLAKGLIGIVLPGGIVFFFILLSRRWSLFREMRLLTGIPLFLAASSPWFILVSLRNPEFPRFFFIHEHFQRFLTKVHGRYEPPWFFLPVLLGGLVPWTFLLPETIRNLVKRWSREKLFLVLWVGVILAFFSLSDSKLIPYILPVFPALALLTGVALSDSLEDRRPWLNVQFLGAALLPALAGVAFLVSPHLISRPGADAGAASAAGALLLAGGVVSLLAVLRRRRDYAAAILSLTVALSAITAPPVVFAGSVWKKSTRELAPIVRERFAGVPLVSYGYYRQDVPFYTGRRVIVAGTSGELEFGRLHEADKGWFIDPPTFVREWNSGRELAVLMARDALPLFRAVAKIPPREVASWGNTILLTNR